MKRKMLAALAALLCATGKFTMAQVMLSKIPITKMGTTRRRPPMPGRA
jgi:hypothetical protein